MPMLIKQQMLSENFFLLAEILLYQFKPVYDVGEESSSTSVPTETEDLGVSRICNTNC